MPVTQEDLLPALSREIERAIGEEVEKAATEAAEQARKRVRERLGAIAGSLLSEYSIVRRQNDLVITVKTTDLEKQGG